MPPTTPPAAGGAAVVLDPCSLLTQAEAAAALGEPASASTVSQGTCYFSNAAGHSHAVSVYAGQGDEAAQAINGPTLFVLSLMGLKIDPTGTQQLNDLTTRKDLKGLVQKLAALSRGNPKFNSQAPAGVGDAAYWVWKNASGGVWEGVIIVAQGDVAVIVSLVVGPKGEAATLKTAAALVLQTLGRLPAKFVH